MYIDILIKFPDYDFPSKTHPVSTGTVHLYLLIAEIRADDLEPILLTWFNFKSNMNK